MEIPRHATKSQICGDEDGASDSESNGENQMKIKHRAHKRRQRQRKAMRHFDDVEKTVCRLMSVHGESGDGDGGGGGGGGAAYSLSCPEIQKRSSDGPERRSRDNATLSDIQPRVVDESILPNNYKGINGFTFDWSRVHEACDPARGGGLKEERARKKRKQCLIIASLIDALYKCDEGSFQNSRDEDSAFSMNPNVKIVDFGAGSGNLVLALAFLFPSFDFVAVEMKQFSLGLLIQRAKRAGLRNLRTYHGMVECFDEPFDCALGLHACGNATDYAIEQACRRKATFIMSPCCIGKLKFSIAGGSSFSGFKRDWNSLHQQNSPSSEGRESPSQSLQFVLPPMTHPRSFYFSTRSSSAKDDFTVVAALADHSAHCSDNNANIVQNTSCFSVPSNDSSKSSVAEGKLIASLSRKCKHVIEMDRCMAASEKGYAVAYLVLPGDFASPNKCDIIMGSHTSRLENVSRLEALKALCKFERL